MGFENVEPWDLEPRTYYQTEQPEPDRANPFFEFDPQMCILCTRCVRACDELRHTTAIGLSNKGYTARIAFGAGGAIHESNCDFCGACIDVCPTATLMERPNKWVGRTEDWTSTTCNSCSVGCTISVGTRAGKGVVVKPDYVNPVSADQICVRGRFHYDAVPDKQRLTRHYVRRAPGAPQMPAHWGELIAHTAEQLKTIIDKHGPRSVGVLGSPFNTNEENYLAQKLARDVIGTPNIDFSQSAANRAAGRAIEAAFGTEAPPSDAINIARSDIIVVIADDLEESHNVFSLLVKDAVAGNSLTPPKAKLVLVSPLRSELADFAEPWGGVWLQPHAGSVADVVDALCKTEVGAEVSVPWLIDGDHEEARRILAAASDTSKTVSIIYAVPPVDEIGAGNGARAAANLAITLRGENAAESLFVLPTEANVNGARDMGVDPERAPGRQSAPEAGMDFSAMINAAAAGQLKAMIIVGDNPLMFAAGSSRVREALEKLELLAVIDGLPTDTAKLAHCLFADVPTYAKTGTFTNAERRVNRLHAAFDALGDARPALLALADLANALKPDSFSYDHPDDVTDEIAATVPGYETFSSKYELWGKARAVAPASRAEVTALVDPPAPTASRDQLLLVTARTLYTSLEGASVHAEEADKLHREEFVELNQVDFAALRIEEGSEVVLATEHGELAIRCKVSDRVPAGVAFVPLYYDGGAVCSLLGRDGAPVSVQVKVRATA
jgi:predicted molibdopterin-dependent oxidoreductase YjgC